MEFEVIQINKHKQLNKKTMKKLVAFLFFVMVSCITVTVNAQDFSLNGQTMVRSKYVGPDGLQFYGDPVIQSNFTLNHKSGLFFDLWISSGFNTKFSNDWDDEIDYTLGWSGKISSFLLNSSLSYFDDFDNFNFTYNDVGKGNIHLGYPKQIKPWLKVVPYVDYITFIIPNKNTPFNGGNMYSVGFDNEIIITEKIKVTPLIQFSLDDGALGVKAGSLLKLASNLNWTLSKHFVWNVVEATFYSPSNKRGMKDELVLGAGLSWNL